MVTGRRECRAGASCRPETVAQALHCLVQHGPLTVEQLVGELASRFDVHVTKGQLYDWSNPYQADAQLACPLRVHHALTRLQHSGALLAAIARDAGYRIEPLASASSSADRVQAECLDVTAAAGLLASIVRATTRDGEFSDDDRLQVRPAIERVKREVADVEAVVEGETGAPLRAVR